MDLKEKLGEELYNTVISKLGTSNIGLLEGFIPKARFNEVNEKAKLLTEKVNSYEAQISKTTELLKGSDELKEAYSKLQKEYKTGLEAKDKEITNLVKKTLLTDLIKEKGAMYPDLLLKNIDMDGVKVYEGKIMNQDDIINPLIDSYKDLFKTEKVVGGKDDTSKNLGKADKSSGEPDWGAIAKSLV